MGGTPKRMEKFAHYMKDLLDYKIPAGLTFHDLTQSGDRYSIFKVGPILFVNHGIGCPSLSVVLNEVIKLIFYAGCTDVTFFRVGTCGGLGTCFVNLYLNFIDLITCSNQIFLLKGVEPGTLVISDEVVDGLFRSEYRQVNLKLFIIE